RMPIQKVGSPHLRISVRLLCHRRGNRWNTLDNQRRVRLHALRRRRRTARRALRQGERCSEKDGYEAKGSVHGVPLDAKSFISRGSALHLAHFLCGTALLLLCPKSGLCGTAAFGCGSAEVRSLLHSLSRLRLCPKSGLCGTAALGCGSV